MRLPILLTACLILLTAFVYAPVRHQGFVAYDDPDYVYANPHVLAGPAPAQLRWAITSTFASNWFPMTWITLMIQAHFFGANPHPYHVVDAAMHALNAVVLFVDLLLLTGSTWRSGIVAMLFAVHPMHVESVAWIAEWKDVLSTFFTLLAIASYCFYVKRRSRPAYAVMLVIYALALAAKPTAVTLAPLLLLIDYWPLQRRMTWQTIVEKIPLLLIAALDSAMTFLAQSRGKSVVAAHTLAVTVRVENALVSYIQYLRKLVFPTDLSVFYPYPARQMPSLVFGSALLLAALTLLVLLQRKSRPYLAVGWFWFLGTLIPVIGLVQVGAQAMADRYSYFPSIGLFIAVVWWGADVAMFSRMTRGIVIAISLAVVICFAVLARRQVSYWRDTQTLFTHAMQVTTGNWVAELLLGNAAFDNGDLPTAAGYFQDVARLRPDDPRGYNNLADCLVRINPQRAIGLYEQAIACDPSVAKFHVNLAAALVAAGETGRALQEIQFALKLDPTSPTAAAAMNDLSSRVAHPPGDSVR